MSDLLAFVRDPSRRIVGQATQFDELTVVERLNDVSRWTLTTTDPDTAALLSTRGAGVVLRRGSSNMMSGPVDYVAREWRDGGQSWTFSGPDDLILVARILAWQKPSAAISAQTDAYDARSGAAEDVIRGYVVANAVTRLGLPLTVPPSSARGSTRNGRARMDNLLELCRTLAGGDDPEFGMRVIQDDSRNLVWQVYDFADLTPTGLLSDLVGTALEWTYTENAPAATRVIVGAGDQAADRMFRQSTNVAQESEWGVVAESFKDRRDIDPSDGTAAQEVAESGAEELASGSASQSFQMWIPDLVGVEYGVNVRVGDLVRAYPGGVPLDDRITEAQVTYGPQGETTQVWVGRKDPDPDERVERDARLLDRRLRQLERKF